MSPKPYFLNRYACAALVFSGALIASENSSTAQETPDRADATVAKPLTTSTELNSLDDIRRLNRNQITFDDFRVIPSPGTSADVVIGPLPRTRRDGTRRNTSVLSSEEFAEDALDPVTVTYPTPTSAPGRPWKKISEPRAAALRKVKEIQAELAAGGDREKSETMLREALHDYFVIDMQHRVGELDDIKRKVNETEANLQKRLDAKDESIDLQVKLLLREADGVSVFGGSVPGTNRSGSGPGAGTPFGLPGVPVLPPKQVH